MVDAPERNKPRPLHCPCCPHLDDFYLWSCWLRAPLKSEAPAFHSPCWTKQAKGVSWSLAEQLKGTVLPFGSAWDEQAPAGNAQLGRSSCFPCAGWEFCHWFRETRNEPLAIWKKRSESWGPVSTRSLSSWLTFATDFGRNCVSGNVLVLCCPPELGTDECTSLEHGSGKKELPALGWLFPTSLLHPREPDAIVFFSSFSPGSLELITPF